jgi:hypothetical protein
MHPVLSSCRIFLQPLGDLIAGVRLLDGAGGMRPALAAKAVAARMAAGLRVIEAYLRRVLIVLALALEPTLVDIQKPLRRPHGRRMKARSFHFVVLDSGACGLSEGWLEALEARRSHRHKAPLTGRTPVAMGHFYRRLDLLAAIAADPLARARRLAFRLALSRPGPILPPDRDMPPPRLLRRLWGTQTSTTFSLMGHEILARSRARPPEMTPIRRHGPSLLVLDG